MNKRWGKGRSKAAQRRRKLRDAMKKGAMRLVGEQQERQIFFGARRG